jgi:hypothetical protein
MNSAPFLRRVSSLPALVALAFSGMLLLSLTLWYWMAWTPIQRYYLGAYFESALAGSDPAWTIDLRRLYKTAPHRNRELAAEDDVIAASLGRDGHITMNLSSSARQQGWDGLSIGPRESFYAASLKPYLAIHFFDGESIWVILLEPVLLGMAAALFLLAGWAMLPRRQRYQCWSWDRIECREHNPSPLLRWRTDMQRIWSRLSELMRSRTPVISAKPLPPAPVPIPPDPPKEQQRQPVFQPFGTPGGKSKEGFTWEKTKGIE